MAQTLKNTFSHPVKVRGVEVAPGESVEVDKASRSEELMFGLRKEKEEVRPTAKKLSDKEAAAAEEAARKQAEEERKAAIEAAERARAEGDKPATEPTATTANAGKNDK